MREALKKLSAIALVCVAGLSAGAAEPGIAVLDKDGTTYEVSIAALDRLSFGSTTLTVLTTSGEEKSYAYGDIEKITLDAEIAGAQTIAANGHIAVWPTLTSSELYISGAEKGTPVYVYTATGALLIATEVGDGTLSLDLGSAPAGLCIVSVGDRSVKVIKK